MTSEANTDYLLYQLGLLGWRRTWINQPSTRQHYHKLNGLEVMAKASDKEHYHDYDEVIYLTKPTMRTPPRLIPRLALARGPKRSG